MSHTNDTHLAKIAGKYQDAEWGYAGMTVRLYWTGLNHAIRSARGVIAMGTIENLQAFAKANFWTIQS